MILVVDTNIIIAAAIRTTITQDIIFKYSFTLYSPEFVKEEINKHKKEILERSRLTESELDIILSILYSRIRIIPGEEYSYLKKQILEFAPDKKDWPFLALAKHLDAILWSNDLALKRKQNVVKVVTTKELVTLLLEKPTS